MAREQRRLAAIISADVVGYSRLMGRDESGTLARLREHRQQRFEPALARHGGRLVKLTGDGALAEFGSAVGALSAVIEFQQAMAEINGERPADDAIVFRIGVHLGDLIVEGEDLYGDGVNVASRLETQASPGGIVASHSVHDAAAGRLKARFHDLGALTLRNIERPVQAFAVRWDAVDWRPAPPVSAAISPPTPKPPALADRPSIAVLPFTNMSGDPEQEYFADGLAEDIITALSHFKSLLVIARNSSFIYKGKSPDVRQVGSDLGVRYVLEGSVRKAGGRVRITGQLVDTATGAHLWADRVDGSLEDVFELQDKVTSSVVGAIAPKLDLAEIERSRRKPVESLDAYDCYLQGLAHSHGVTRASCDEAYRLSRRAMELDPDFAAAYGLAAKCLIIRKSKGWEVDRDREETETRRLASRVAVIGGDDALALCTAGYALAFVCRDHDAAMALIDRSLVTNPNLAFGWQCRGWLSVMFGHHEAALEQLDHALRLSPLDPTNLSAERGMSAALLHLGRYDEATKWANAALARQPDDAPSLRTAAVINALAGRLEEARRTTTHLRRLYPEMRLSQLGDKLGLGRQQDIDRFLDGLRLAGLPE